MRSWIVAIAMVVLLGSAARPAAADSPARLAAKSLLANQIAAIGTGDAKAFAATLAPDAIVILPGAEARGQAAITRAAAAWFAGNGKILLKANKALHGTLIREPDYDYGAWYDTTLAVSGATTTTWRLTAVVGVSGALDDEATVQDFRVIALHISAGHDDKAVLAAAAAGALPAATPFAVDPDARTVEEAWQPHRIATWAAHVHKDAATVLVGSAPKERFVGKAAVTGVLKKWKGLKLATGDAVLLEPPDSFFSVVVGHATATFTVKGKAVTVPYRVLMVIASDQAAAEVPSTLAAAHFSVVDPPK